MGTYHTGVGGVLLRNSVCLKDIHLRAESAINSLSITVVCAGFGSTLVVSHSHEIQGSVEATGQGGKFNVKGEFPARE